jgi:hypothetical protein
MTQRIHRREFTTAMTLALLGGATITVSACGGSGYGGGGNPSGPSGGGGEDNNGYGNGDNPGDGVAGVISANHGHQAFIARARLTLGEGMSLDIMGNATHRHVVELSAAEIVTIRGGGRVSKTSSDTQGHQHTVTFN